MKEGFKSYLDSVELSSVTVKDNIERIYRYASTLCPEKIVDIFVSDFIKDDGSREYGSLWFFSQSYVMEARNFRNEIEYDIDVAKLHGWVAYYRAHIKDYDFNEASVKSRIMLEVFNVDTVSCEFKASGVNCDKLNSIIQTYIRKNILDETTI
ncbi:MAG: hypothetical protein MUO17_01770 [Dehalococcoidales bacterium]|nr:hypothetical protein [Dehalococcoidales bacterium]